MQNTIATALLLLSTLIVVGCGSDLPKTAIVAGKVTYGGQPVTQGTVTFYPETGRASLGYLQSDGSYVLTVFNKGDGAIIGKHSVTIEAHRFASVGKLPESMEEEIDMARSRDSLHLTKTEWLVPERYSRRDTSGLTAEVNPSSNDINFDLSSE